MSNIFKITCPECGEKFDPGSAIDNHIENEAKQKEEKIKKESEKKFKSQIEAKDKEIEKSKKDAEKKAQLEADKKYKSQLALKDKEIEKNLKEAELVPGAKQFIDSVRTTTTTIIFLSNRMTKNELPTIENMKALNIYEKNDDWFMICS